jgi:signal transduction histidine kinase
LGLLEAGTLGEIPPKALDILKIANKNSERLILLVNDILDMEKLLSGKMVYSMEPVNLGSLLRHSIESNAAYAANYDVTYRLTTFEEVRVLADANRLLQVMANMMSNAAKFSPANSVVEIGYAIHNQFIRVTVEDHGAGIPEEFRDRIFGAFSQANSTDGRKHGGTGLGLNISKKLMQDMGGEMGYVSSTGIGTTFWIDLVVI